MNKVKKFFTKLKWENIIAAILAIIVGVLFIILPKDSADVLCLIAGILLICAGAFTLVAYIFSKIDSWNSETHLMKKGTFCIFSGMAIYISRGSLLASMAYTLGLVLSCYVISKVVHVGVKKINLNIP